MKQSRRMSLVEAATNVVGYAVAVLTQLLVFPIFGLQASPAVRQPGHGLTAVSIGRSYVLRRVFEAFLALAAQRR